MQIKVLRNFDRIIAVSYSIKEDLLKRGLMKIKFRSYTIRLKLKKIRLEKSMKDTDR